MAPEVLTNEFAVEAESAPSPFDHLVELCRQNELPIDAEHLSWLIPNISIEELKDHPVGKEFGVNPAAILTGEGLLLDRRIEDWSISQQRYLLGHELGHCLSHYLEQTDPDRWQELMGMVKQIGPREHSHYIDYLDEKLPEDHHQEKLSEEKLAELFTQYLNGEGTFAGMIATKLLTSPNLPSANQEDYQRLVEHAQDFEKRLQEVSPDEEPTGLLRQYPKLTPHYQAWKMVKSLLCDPETFAALEEAIIGEEGNGGYLGDDPLFDYPEMVEHIPTPEPSPADPPTEKLPFDFLKFWQILGS